MSAYLHQFLADCMGLTSEQAEKVLETLELVQVIPAGAVDRFELRAKAHYLRGQGVSCRDIGARFGMDRATAFRLVREYTKIRRVVLRLAS